MTDNKKRRFYGNQNDGKSPLERLLEKVESDSNGCWLFIGCIDSLGYGRVRIAGENKAHRLSWKLHNGSIPLGMCILHKCDVRNCVNPSHLWLGTQDDNMKDCAKKKRIVTMPQYGEDNPMSKLTKESVIKIRELAKTIKQIEISRMFSVSPMTISRVVSRKLWKTI